MKRFIGLILCFIFMSTLITEAKKKVEEDELHAVTAEDDEFIKSSAVTRLSLRENTVVFFTQPGLKGDYSVLDLTTYDHGGNHEIPGIARNNVQSILWHLDHEKIITLKRGNNPLQYRLHHAGVDLISMSTYRTNDISNFHWSIRGKN